MKILRKINRNKERKKERKKSIFWGDLLFSSSRSEERNVIRKNFLRNETNGNRSETTVDRNSIAVNYASRNIVILMIQYWYEE